ncbi:hypothetical protein PYW08_016022 [Mythimna loreyi]|uniref:Uncharacterized protein n=1 Tax=Mythimna loreyi TaxID=667449 RepID=A0ACC2QSY0_9NEOP|nr:hypothetical protein PYW08_016022 [Mythimna loreyi]
MNIFLFLATFITSRRGKKMIRFNGYNFNQVRARGARIRWACSTHHRFGCKAAIRTIDDIIVAVNENHEHKALRYVLSQRGRRMIQVNGFTYSLLPSKSRKKRWRCSTHSPNGCHAHVFTLDDLVIAVNGIHEHRPQNVSLNKVLFCDDTSVLR